MIHNLFITHPLKKMPYTFHQPKARDYYAID